MPKIKVHEKALGHLSRGLYRSPASALRELISNAWDANARLVQVTTNYPFFYQVSIQDNGDGFTRQEFENLMGGGIGNSDKRKRSSPLINNRPIIGRLGIGMLGIAQICLGFTITSKTSKGEGFRAYVRLYDFLKERLDRDDVSIVKDLSVTDGSADSESVQVVDIGEYYFDKEFDPKTVDYGTTLITNDIHPTFVRTFQESINTDIFSKFKEPQSDWMKNLKVFSGVHSLHELGDYWRLFWELSASCPVPYVSDRALPKGLIVADQEKLESVDFKVKLDGVQIYKPVFLRGNKAGYTTKKIEKETRTVYGNDLVFHGYIVVQEAAQIKPDELRGILVRIKNVGIGYYDPSMLDYRFNEGPRSRWITGEIYVEDGLEDALNIDRDSFNRFHPQFRTLQNYIHNVLHDEIFPQVYKQISSRTATKTKTREEKHSKHLEAVVSKALETPVRVREVERDYTDEIPQVEIIEKPRNMELVLPKHDAIKIKKNYRQLAGSILAIYEISLQEKTNEKKREVFAELLFDLLGDW